MKALTPGVVAIAAIGLAACSQPDTPSNAAIDFIFALRGGEVEEAIEYVCDEVRTDLTPADVESGRWGPFEGILAAPGGAVGSDAEFTADQELDLEVSSAWVEYEFRSAEGVEEIWRITTVRQRGGWKVCAAEQVR